MKGIAEATLMRHWILYSGLAAILAGSPAFAETIPAETAAPAAAFSFSPSGYAGFQTFRLVRYQYKHEDYQAQQYNNTVYSFNLDMKSGPYFSMHAGIEGAASFTTIPRERVNANVNDPWAPGLTMYIYEAEAVYSLNSDNLHGLRESLFHGEIGMGLFPYKYNQQARNLGEYVFRTGTYPGWIKTSFDYPVARLTGLRFSSTLFNRWKNDLLLTTEMEMSPFYDLSFSWITSVPVGDIADFGAGVSFCRFLPARGDYTTPEWVNNIAGIDSSKTASGVDRFDTTYFTHRGVKPMVRATLNTKGVLNALGLNGTAPFLRNDDGKIYAEAAILGVENQGIDNSAKGTIAWYNDIKKRIPVMAGINWSTHPLLSYPIVLPALGYALMDYDFVVNGKRIDTANGAAVVDVFKKMNTAKVKSALIMGGVGLTAGAASWLLNKIYSIDGSLDLLSMEVEYYGNPYPNDYGQQIHFYQESNSALPFDPTNRPQLEAMKTSLYDKDNWKWSVYARKYFGPHFALVAQVAKDHIRTINTGYGTSNTDTEEALIAKNNWYVVTKAVMVW